MAVIKQLKRKLRAEEGQMTVELCVVLPVVIIIAAIVVNALTFFGDCAAFDRASRNAVRIAASSVSESATNGQMSAEVVDMVMAELGTDAVECETSGRFIGDGFGIATEQGTTFTLTYEYYPTLFGLPLRSSIFGVSIPPLSHSISLTVDTYSVGKWLWSYID